MASAKYSTGNAEGLVLAQQGEFAGELVGDGGSAEAEAFKHERDDVAFLIERGFDFAAQPVFGLARSDRARRV